MTDERRLFDYHTHSTASDGSLTPAALAAEAVRVGLAGLALTDHDTVDGVEDFLIAAEALGLAAVGGVEISLEHPGTMHLLGYNAGGGPGLPAALGRLKAFRLERNKQLQEKLAALGYPLDWERLLEKSGGGQLGRPHFAALLVEEGFFSSTQEVFDRLLGKGQPGYVDKRRMSVAAGLAVIVEAGWVPVLAHPASVSLARADWPKFLAGLKERGLAGLEVRHPSLNAEESAFFLNLAQELDLVPTAGSDFHGASKPDIGLDWALHHDFFGAEVLQRLRSRYVPST